MLLEKIVEEAQELATAAPDEMINELADLYEVIESILSAYGIKQQAVLDAQTSRRKERGGFNSRVRLVWVE
jgi:predicted house-cleaning noncanonical NTP pyrophosphatase (MazG superfamily)